jgi:8-oxo-dGTP diphosphatase
MRILCEVNTYGTLTTGLRTSHRSAVRAIIWRGNELLLIHSSINGDYKFPGGGVEPGETNLQALAREVLEETGQPVSAIGTELGCTKEWRPSNWPGMDVLEMESIYYLVEIDPDAPASLRLDIYEAELGFHPVWISLEAAIRVNEQVIRSGNVPVWAERDTAVMHFLANEAFPRG